MAELSKGQSKVEDITSCGELDLDELGHYVHICRIISVLLLCYGVFRDAGFEGSSSLVQKPLSREKIVGFTHITPHYAVRRESWKWN